MHERSSSDGECHQQHHGGPAGDLASHSPPLSSASALVAVVGWLSPLQTETRVRSVSQAVITRGLSPRLLNKALNIYWNAAYLSCR